MSTQMTETTTTEVQSEDPTWVQDGMRRVAEDADSNTDERDDVDGDDESQEDESDNFDLKRAQAKIRKANREAAAQRRQREEAEKKAATLPDLQKENGDLKSRLARMEVAMDLGLPKVLAARLTGSTQEEILADAEALLKLLPQSSSSLQSRPRERFTGSGEPAEAPEKIDPAAIFGRN